MKPRTPAVELLGALQPGALIYPAFCALQPPRGRRLGLAAGILLSQAFYLSRASNGGEWEYTPGDWSDRTGLSPDQVTDGLKRLEDAGLLSRHRIGVVKRMRYRLEVLTLSRMLTNSVPVTGKSGYGKPEIPVTGNRKIRLPVYKDLSSSYEEERGRNASPRCIRARAVSSATGKLGATWEEWEAYGRELSPAWVASGDCRECWDDMEAVEWRDSSRRLVRDWQPKARRYLAAWRRKGGVKAETASDTESPEREAARKEAGAKRFAALEELASAGRWLEVLEIERDWEKTDPEQFQFYWRCRRPKEWTKKAASASRSSKAA